MPYISQVDVGKLECLSVFCDDYNTNYGTGNNYSVLEMVKAFNDASGKDVAYKIVDRIPGDVAMCYTGSSKAEAEFGWIIKFKIK